MNRSRTSRAASIRARLTASISLFTILAVLSPITTSALAIHGGTHYTVDINDASCGAGGADFCTIDDALGVATDGDVIEVAAGTYADNLFINHDVDIIGAGRADVIITRDPSNTSDSVVKNNGSIVTIKGATVTGGDAPSQGGGIANIGSAAEMTLIDVLITGNTVGTNGGGIGNKGALVEIIDSEISNNTSTNGDGGGIFTDLGSVVITNSILADNFSGGLGGGVHLDGGSGRSLTITDTTISGNTAKQGGGISARVSGTVDIVRSTISGNMVATNKKNEGLGDGGGVWLDGPDLTATNSTFSGNDAGSLSGPGGRGGGVYAMNGTVLLNSVTVTLNSAPDAGTADQAAAGSSTMAPPSPSATPSSSATSARRHRRRRCRHRTLGTSTTSVGDPQLGPLQDNGGPDPHPRAGDDEPGDRRRAARPPSPE